MKTKAPPTDRAMAKVRAVRRKLDKVRFQYHALRGELGAPAQRKAGRELMWNLMRSLMVDKG